MAETCKDLGMEFGDIGAPDPTSEIGVAGAQQYVIEKLPTWVEKYGKNTAFFTTNDALDEPLIRQVAKYGAIYVEATYASPTMGYPGALGIEFEEEDKGNWPRILKKVEDAVIEAGNSGRMGCWAFSYAYCVAAGLGEHAKNVIEGKSEILDKSDLMKALAVYSPGAGWNSTYYVDADGVERENYFMVYQDTYIFGKGFLGQTSEVVPEKYYDIGKK